MSKTIDVSATAIQDDRSGWQAEDQIAVEYLEACKEILQSHPMMPLQILNLILSTKLF